VTITDTGGFQRRDEGPGWFGNFALGDQLLWDQRGGPVTFTFSQGISGIGFNISDNSYGAFTATLTTSDGTPFVFSGVSNGNEDGSAPFVGVKDLTGANITSLTIVTSAPSANDFAFNRLLLQDTPVTAPTPEPSSFLLLGSGLMGLAGVVRARIGAR
jgi:hypothetical protein